MDQTTNKISDIDRDLDETKELLVKNANKLIERTNYLNNIEDTTETLANNSTLFRRRTHTISWNMWLQKYYCCFIGILLCLFFTCMFIIIYYANLKDKDKDLMK